MAGINVIFFANVSTFLIILFMGGMIQLQPRHDRDRDMANHDEPIIELEAGLLSGLTVRAGHPIRLAAYIRGKPDPEVWWEADPELDKTRTVIGPTEDGSECVLKNSQRTDSGLYEVTASLVTASNDAGEKSATCMVTVLDFGRAFQSHSSTESLTCKSTSSQGNFKVKGTIQLNDTQPRHERNRNMVNHGVHQERKLHHHCQRTLQKMESIDVTAEKGFQGGSKAIV
ncbi:uncharacterized protein LOC144916772 isoform X2 [Branchiostoma floridae x Branchiostoma belcheri]